jgi:DNA-binding XRE family transcriptional regulator
MKENFPYNPKAIEQSIHLKDAIIKEMVARYKSKGIRREWIANALDIPPSSMLRIERGDYKLSLDRFFAICEIIEEEPLEIISTVMTEA